MVKNPGWRQADPAESGREIQSSCISPVTIALRKIQFGTVKSSKMETMNYYGAKELAEAFRTVRENTLMVAEEIDEKHYGFRATPETRAVAQTLLHLGHAAKL